MIAIMKTTVICVNRFKDMIARRSHKLQMGRTVLELRNNHSTLLYSSFILVYIFLIHNASMDNVAEILIHLLNGDFNFHTELDQCSFNATND